MYTNADMTLYHWDGEKFIREVIKEVFWQPSRISNINKAGRTDADSVFISIPTTSKDNLMITTGKDLVVKGVCELEFDNTSEKTQSESLKILKKSHETFVVNVFDPKLYGSSRMQHYELSCR